MANHSSHSGGSETEGMKERIAAIQRDLDNGYLGIGAEEVRFLLDRVSALSQEREALADIFFAARKHDDKPHQLYSAIAKAASVHADESLRAEISRLMMEAYDRPRSSEPPTP